MSISSVNSSISSSSTSILAALLAQQSKVAANDDSSTTAAATSTDTAQALQNFLRSLMAALKAQSDSHDHDRQRFDRCLEHERHLVDRGNAEFVRGRRAIADPVDHRGYGCGRDDGCIDHHCDHQ